MYTLRLLGGFALLDSLGEPVQRLAQRRAEAVLALLALSGDLGCTRDRLVSLLWAESDESHARHSLRNVLHALRLAVGPDAVLTSGDILRLNPAVIDVDVQRFARSLQLSRLEDAAQCYRGPLLDGFHVDEAQEFDLWLEQERARLYRECAEALERLATQAEQADDWRSAASWWQRVAEHDPHNSRLVIMLMRSLAAVGDRANALLFAEAHRRRLSTELDIEPGSAFETEVARLRHESGYRNGALPDASAGSPVDAPFPNRAARRVGAAATVAADDTGELSGISPPSVRRPRRAVLAVIALCVAGVGASAWWGFRSAPASLDPDLVAIMPFSAGGHANLTAEADEIHDIIIRELLEGPAPHAVEPAVATQAWRRANGADSTRDPRAVDADVARRTRATLVLRGTLDSAAGGRLLNLTLVRLPSRRVVARRTAALSGGDVSSTVRRVLLEVLALEAGEPTHRLRELVSHPAPAVRLYLAGMRREGAVPNCRVMLKAVWAIDSSLVYPGLACAVPVGYEPVQSWKDSVLRAVWQRRTTLVFEDAAYANALVGPWFGLADNAEQRIALWNVAAGAAPQWWVPSAMLAQELVNFGPRTTIIDWKRDALVALRRALEACAWSQRNPVEMAFWSGIFFSDTALAQRAVAAGARLQEAGPQYPFALHTYWFGNPADWPWLFDAAFGSGAEADRMSLRLLGEGRTWQGFRTLALLAKGRPRTAVLADSFAARWSRTTEGRTPLGVQFWFGVHWRMRGDYPRWREHARLEYLYGWAKRSADFDDIAVEGSLVKDALYLGAPEDTIIALASARMERVVRGDSSPAPPPRARGVAHCWLAQWRLAHGDTTGVATAIAFLRDLDAEDRAGRLDGIAGSGRWVVCPAVLEAQRARLVGRGALEAARALDRLLRPYPVPRRSAWTFYNDLSHDNMRPYIDNLLAARLLAAAGDTAAALAAVRRKPRAAAFALDFFDMPTDHLRYEGQLASARADTLGAIAAYEEYLTYRASPPAHPPWRAEWDSVRAELARLRPRR